MRWRAKSILKSLLYSFYFIFSVNYSPVTQVEASLLFLGQICLWLCKFRTWRHEDGEMNVRRGQCGNGSCSFNRARALQESLVLNPFRLDSRGHCWGWTEETTCVFLLDTDSLLDPRCHHLSLYILFWFKQLMWHWNYGISKQKDPWKISSLMASFSD